MANLIIPVLYTSDAGQDYVTGLNGEVYAQVNGEDDAKVGGAVPAVIPAGTPPLPSSVKPRRAYMKNPAGKGRYVICLTPTSDLATDAATTISLEDSDGAATTFHRVKVLGEDFGRSRI